MEQPLGLAEQVLAPMEVTGCLGPGLLKQEGHYPKLLLVLLVHAQLELVWARAWAREQMQAQPHRAHPEAEKVQPYEHLPAAILVVRGKYVALLLFLSLWNPSPLEASPLLDDYAETGSRPQVLNLFLRLQEGAARRCSAFDQVALREGGRYQIGVWENLRRRGTWRHAWSMHTLVGTTA